MSAGSRRNGTSKTGPFPLAGPGRRERGGATDSSGERPPRYTARHATARPKTARRAGKAAPAAAIAATLAAGAAAYGLIAGQSGDGKAAVALNLPATAGTAAGSANADAAAARLVGGPATAHATSTPARRATAAPSPAHPAPTATVQATAAATAKPSPTAATLTCSDTSSLLPANVTAIVTFLLANGYTHNAAAGIAGNIYQESKGDPESIGSGGGGLIGWTPLRAGLVTGSPSADLQTQLAAILTYNAGWSGYLPALNAAATPADAAYIYVTDFERAGIPAASTREASADAVAAACGL